MDKGGSSPLRVMRARPEMVNGPATAGSCSPSPLILQAAPLRKQACSSSPRSCFSDGSTMPTVQDTTSFGETQWLHNVTGSTRPGDTCVFDLGDGRVLRIWCRRPRSTRSARRHLAPMASCRRSLPLRRRRVARSCCDNAFGAYVRWPGGRIAGVGASVMPTGIVDDSMPEFFFIQNEASAAAACASRARTWSSPSRGPRSGFDTCACFKWALSRGARGCGLPVRTGSC